MRFKIDENLPDEAAAVLASAGHDATTVGQQGRSGAPDETLAELCRNENRALVTLDTDFADIRTYPPAEYPGLVVLRTARQDRRSVLGMLKRLAGPLRQEPLAGRLWIVEEKRVRVHGGPTD